MDQDAALVLLACLNYTGDAEKIGNFARMSAGEWRIVVDLAYLHKVAPLLYDHIRRMNIALPGDLEEEFKQAHGQNAFRNMHLYQDLNRLLRWFQAETIPVIVLKGAYLAGAVYESVGLRTMGDVDLLVKKEDVIRIEQRLLTWGFVPEISERVITDENYHFRYTLEDNNFIIEIHWKLLGSNFPFLIDMEELWSRAQPVILAQVPTLAFSMEDLLLHLCLHTIKHAYKYRVEHDVRIRSLCDIGEVVSRYGAELNWEQVGVRAHQWGTVCADYMVLRMAQELLGAPVPIGWLNSLKPESFDERYMAVARQETFGAVPEGHVVGYEQKQAARLWGSGGPLKKLALIFESIFQSRESMASMYPAPANSWRIYLYYPVRVKDILTRHAAMFWRLVWADPKISSRVERSNQLEELHEWLMSG